MLISIIAPMYNEEENVERTFSEIEKEMKKFPQLDYEVLFVDDGSTDNSFNIARDIAGKNKRLKVIGYGKNLGRGYAIRTGFRYARGDIFITIDFDLSYSADHIGKMLNILLTEPFTDVVLVSAYMPGGQTKGVPFYRLVLSKLGNCIYRYAFKPPIYTSTCIVRAYRKNVIKYILLNEDDKEVHLEIISKILANGFRIKEIPGVLTKRKKGKSKFRFQATIAKHLIYFFHEKPFYLFGMIGILFLIIGVVSSIIIIYSRFSGDVEFTESVIGRIVSPNFVILNFIFGFQFLGLGFLGAQNSYLKKELFRIQRQIEYYNRDEK